MKHCVTCGESFRPTRAQKRCDDCRRAVCPTCGVEFLSARQGRVYCSRQCSDADVPSEAERLARHWRELPSGCWEWTSARDPQGYGHSSRRDATGAWKTAMAHRHVYEVIVGPIPDGLELDHLCRNTSCVNPSHLEPVSGAENMRRRYATQGHCKHGHAFTPENTYRTSAGHRSCRVCQRAAAVRYRNQGR